MLLEAHSGFIAGSIETRKIDAAASIFPLAHSGFIAGSIETEESINVADEVEQLIPALLPAQLKPDIFPVAHSTSSCSFRLYCRLN